MAKVLIVAEQRNGNLKKATLELVYASATAGNETDVALLGNGIEALANELAQHGASKIHLAEHEKLTLYTAEAYSQVISHIASNEKPEIILASHTPTGREFMPIVAATLGAGLASDCISASFDDGLKLRRPVYAGKASAEVEFLGDGLKMATIRPNSLGNPKKDAAKDLNVIKVNPSLDALVTKGLDLVKGQSGRPDVTEASVVVSGGRSLKNAENFQLLEQMADTLGAAVGASRAAVDAGYRPHRDQVGQTGKVVSPSLYIACGISGAIQHLAGMRTSKCIVAINTDAEAPIFQVADYGIVGDLFEIVPLLTEEFKKIKEA